MEPARDVTLIVCGAPLTARTVELVQALHVARWRPSVVGTGASVPWVDVDGLAAVLGEPVRFEFRAPGQAKRARAAAAVVVCPATFNTVNKTAAGINDSYAMGLVSEAIGSGLPVVMVPMVNDKLWGHPAWSRSLATLADAGVRLLDVHSGQVGTSAVTSGTGDEVVARFDPRWVVDGLNAVAGADR